jgi:uncharacterized protein YndB with AHSA1/START domain
MAAGKSAEAIAEPADRVLVITRVFDAPRSLVYQAFADPKHALKWGGPPDYPAVHVEGDLRPGGKWRTCLRALDGSRELWQGGVYREIVPNERLVYSFAWDQEDGSQGPETLVTVTFADQGRKTLMTFRQAVFNTKENCDGHRRGWNGAFDRLADHVARR